MASTVCACGAPRTNGAKCKECYNAYMRDYMRANRDKTARKAVLARYNMVQEDYDRMYQEQNGQCAICGVKQDKPFAHDPFHACCDRKGSCGACVRGLLCNGCNTGISRFGDDPDKLGAAALYVRARSKNPHV